MFELGAGHIRQDFLESGQKPGYIRFFWDFGFGDRFRRFALHRFTQCIPLDSTEQL
jgi:hypothetical protein